MGMIMIVLWMLYILPAVGIYKLTKRYSTNRWIHRSVLAILILIPTYDIILTNILGGYYCLTTPSTYVNKKVEYPLSIYWNSSVTSGLNQDGRKLMIINYLDGIHLKKMALNGDDGKVYVYHLDKPMLEEIKKEFDSTKYKDVYDQYTMYVIDKSEKVYTKQTMPKMNYTVTFDEIRLNPLSRKFLYSDETKVIDNNTGEVIAYNRRYMPFFYHIAPDFALGNRYYSSWGFEVCAQENNDIDKIFSSLIHYYSVAETPGLNEELYKKYIKKGE
jgi:hypothetical protein